MNDLISRSALTEELEKLRASNPHVNARSRSQHNSEITSCIHRVQITPTVDAKPVVHGEWIVGSKPRCSICGKPALREYDRDDWLSYVPSNFCPNCGADMRKKVEE